MKRGIVGYTGFVGSNLVSTSKFDYLYNSKNIGEAFDVEHDILIYAGVSAEKYLANNDPEKDMQLINTAIENIGKIKFKKLVLISTIDVYKDCNGVDENTAIEIDGLHPYGLNRYRLEEWVRNNVSDYHIIRLPALFGANLKKNFIYDIITVIPFMLTPEKFDEIRKDFAELNLFYTLEGRFYKLNTIDEHDRKILKHFFMNYKFNAIKFTDSRNIYQFYNLKNLSDDIDTAIDKNISLLNIATEPISTSEIYASVFNKTFSNEILKERISYDMKSIHYKIYGGKNGYLYSKDNVLLDLKEFINAKVDIL